MEHMFFGMLHSTSGRKDYKPVSKNTIEPPKIPPMALVDQTEEQKPSSTISPPCPSGGMFHRSSGRDNFQTK
jgi:hypothetical protein